MPRGPRAINPRVIGWIDRAIREHPGEEPWNVTDLSLWTHRLALADGYNRGAGPGTIDRAISETPDLLALAVEGRIALPPLTARSKDPEWLSQVPDREAIPRVAKGQAYQALRDEVEEKADQIADPDARQEYLDLAYGHIDMMAATPTKRMAVFAENEEASFNVTNRLSDVKLINAEQKANIDRLMAQMETTNRLMLRFMGEEPTGPRAARGRARQDHPFVPAGATTGEPEAATAH